MINFLLFVVAIACFGAAAAWIAENPGEVTIYWFDLRIDTSFAFLLLLSAAASLALTFILMTLRRLMLAPSRMREKRTLRRYRKAIGELTYSVASLGASDLRNADLHTRRAEKLLGQTPLTLLLSAQIARSRGDDQKTRFLLEQMLSHKETQYLAARSLSDTASKQQALPQALEMAKRAHEMNPKDAAGVAAMVGLQIRLENWKEALATLRRARWKRFVTGAQAVRMQGMVYLSQAEKLLGGGQAQEALASAQQAIRRLREFSPAVLMLARAKEACGQRAQALRLLTNTAKKNPHPELAEFFRTLLSREPAKNRDKLAKAFSDHEKIDDLDKLWTCRACGHRTATWSPHCPSCSAFDMLGWK